jgi:hypothetical protein
LKKVPDNNHEKLKKYYIFSAIERWQVFSYFSDILLRWTSITYASSYHDHRDRRMVRRDRGLNMLVKQSVFLKLKNMMCSRMLKCCSWSPPPAAARSAATATADPPARPRRRRAAAGPTARPLPALSLPHIPHPPGATAANNSNNRARIDTV